MKPLDDQAIEDALDGLRWAREGDALVTTRVLPGFRDALEYVNRVGDLAEARNHHPEIAIAYNRVSLVLSTHDAGGITDLDVELAAAVDALGA